MLADRAGRSFGTHIPEPRSARAGRFLSAVFAAPIPGGNTPRAFVRGRDERPSGAGRPATPQGPLHRNSPKTGAKEKTQQRLGLTVMGRQPRGGRPPRSARTGSRRHRPQKAGKRGGRERTLCTIIGACRRRRGGKHPVGRNGEGEESCIARILFHAQGNDPSQGARRRGSHPAPPLQRVRMFHVKHSG